MNITDTFIDTAQRLLPSWFIERFRGDWSREGFKKYFANTGWLFGARMITFLTSFLTVAIVARYLGPENLGKLEYAQSIVAIVSIFATLGIDQIVFRELINQPEKENELIGTAIASKLIFGSFAFCLSIVISIILNNEPLITGMIALIAATFFLNPIGTLNILFNARVQAKYASQITIFLAFFLPALKLLTVYLGKGIIYFAAIILIEATASAVWSLYVYIFRFKKNPRAWRSRVHIFKSLMIDSWPLFLAGLSGFIYGKMDQVMILHFLDATTVGIYSVAVKLTQVWAFIPSMIIGSLFPALISSRATNYTSYARRFKALSGITIGITALIAVPLFIFAPYVILLIFGKSFMAASPVLRIHLWISLAGTMTALIQHFLIAENLGKIFLYSSVIGASANITLNIILIPILGAPGAAWGTMISYFVVIISLFLFKESRTGIFKILRTTNNN
jgi:O-antigen/teichoic acid export membrane protein